MLRECAEKEALAKVMLISTQFLMFFGYVQDSNIGLDVFSTFKVIRFFVCLTNKLLFEQI